MAVLIEGMEMPTNNDMSPTAVWVYPNGYAIVFKDNGKMKQYTEAVSVPEPHGLLIDADEFYEALTMDDRVSIIEAIHVKSILSEVPTVIPASEGG